MAPKTARRTACPSPFRMSPRGCSSPSACSRQWRLATAPVRARSWKPRCWRQQPRSRCTRRRIISPPAPAPPRIGQQHRGSAPYRVFATSDGYITFGASQQKFFVSLCGLIGAPELLADPRFGKNADRVANNAALVELIQAKLVTRTSAEWLAALEAAGIPAGPVLHYDEVFTDPQILARNMVVETEHPVTGKFRTLGVPVKLSQTPGAVRRAAPKLGEHTAEVLATLGKKAAE